MVEEVLKLELMRLVDGELSQAVAAAYVSDLSADRALLRAAFPVDPSCTPGAVAAIDAALAARHGETRPWRLAMPIAASVLAAVVVGTGSMLVAERRAEEGATRVVRAFAQDRQLSAAAFVEALDRQVSGQSVVWRNPDSGSSGAIKPLRTFRAADGRFCREYEQRLEAPGGSKRVTGIACREGGRWRPAIERPEAI